MPGATANYGLPYPELDEGANVPADMQALADAVDATLAAFSTVPAGVMVDYGGAAAPADWLLCDGSAVSRATYADLFTALGTAYGVGDGSTTFNLPDFRGRVAVGLGTHADVDARAKSDGEAVGSRRPKHKTSVTANPGVNGNDGTWVNNQGQVAYGDPNGGSEAIAAVGGQYGPQSLAPTDTPAYLVALKIVKV